jgi:hypothetical protein
LLNLLNLILEDVDMTARGGMFAIGCAGLLFGGCAAEVERPTEDLTRASTLIEQADRAGGQRYAAAELQQAREKLSQANAAVEDGDAELALRRAREAAADAELASARTASGEAQRAAEELHRSTETLRDEANRGMQDSSTTPPAGTSPPR